VFNSRRYYVLEQTFLKIRFNHQENIMKKNLLGFIVVSSFSAFAGPMHSIALKGNYELNKIVEDGGMGRDCPNLLTVNVSESGINLYDTNTDFSFMRFDASKEGWKNKVGDAGPWRIKTLTFNKKSVRRGDTQPMTGIGYVSTVKYAKFNKVKNQLVIGDEATAIPVGIIGIDYDVQCVYDRLAANK
jgi:hypothetical protein